MASIGWTGVALLVLAAGQPLAAQVPCPDPGPDSAAAPPSRPPDVLIRATVRARRIRFETRPDVSVDTRGCLPWDTVVVTERVNLPDPVEPGVTYQDVRVGVEIRSWLRLRCLLPDTLGSRASLCATLGAVPDTLRR